MHLTVPQLRAGSRKGGKVFGWTMASNHGRERLQGSEKCTEMGVSRKLTTLSSHIRKQPGPVALDKVATSVSHGYVRRV